MSEEQVGSIEKDLLKLEGMDNELAASSRAAGVKTRDALADLALDELVELGAVDEERAKQLIMKAREHWFAKPGSEDGQHGTHERCAIRRRAEDAAELLLEQLQAAGVNKTLAEDTLTEQDKTQLLDYLRKSHGAGRSQDTRSRSRASRRPRSRRPTRRARRAPSRSRCARSACS